MMLMYIVGAYLVSGVLTMGLVSEACLSKGECSTADRANSKLVTYLFLAGALAIAIQGWRGRLWGARSRIEMAPLAPVSAASEPPLTR